MVRKKHKLPAWLVWTTWVVASLAGANVVVGVSFVLLSGIPEINQTQWFVYIALPAFSILIPLLQWLVAKEYLPSLGFWILGSILGGIIGALITTFITEFFYAVMSWRLATILLTVIFWISLGAAQCLMLCNEYKMFGMWTVAILLGGLILGLIIGRSIVNPLNLAFLAAVSAVFICFGLRPAINPSNRLILA